MPRVEPGKRIIGPSLVVSQEYAEFIGKERRKINFAGLHAIPGVRKHTVLSRRGAAKLLPAFKKQIHVLVCV